MRESAAAQPPHPAAHPWPVTPAVVPGAQTLLPAPYLTASGSNASTASSPPTHCRVRTRSSNSLGRRQFAEPAVYHWTTFPEAFWGL